MELLAAAVLAAAGLPTTLSGGGEAGEGKGRNALEGSAQKPLLKVGFGTLNAYDSGTYKSNL